MFSRRTLLHGSSCLALTAALRTTMAGVRVVDRSSVMKVYCDVCDVQVRSKQFTANYVL
jgi:hypothetical protein